MLSLRCFHALPTLFPRSFHALSTLFIRSLYALSTFFPRFLHALSTLFPCCFHAVSTLFPHSFHALSTLFPRSFHAISTLFPRPVNMLLTSSTKVSYRSVCSDGWLQVSGTAYCPSTSSTEMSCRSCFRMYDCRSTEGHTALQQGRQKWAAGRCFRMAAAQRTGLRPIYKLDGSDLQDNAFGWVAAGQRRGYGPWTSSTQVSCRSVLWDGWLQVSGRTYGPSTRSMEVSCRSVLSDG